jgi:hypothetical protein
MVMVIAGSFWRRLLIGSGQDIQGDPASEDEPVSLQWLEPATLAHRYDEAPVQGSTGAEKKIVRPASRSVRLWRGHANGEDAYRLCYIRGPEGLLIGLAQELG